MASPLKLLREAGLIRQNLIFFARLHGMRRRLARDRALQALDQVGLAEAANVPVGRYSHGMQKRLSVARAPKRIQQARVLVSYPGRAAGR